MEKLRQQREEEEKRQKEKNFGRFSAEVLDSIKRCLESGLKSKDIAPEIKGSRSSYAVEATQIIEAISSAIFALSTENGKFQFASFEKVTHLHVVSGVVFMII